MKAATASLASLALAPMVMVLTMAVFTVEPIEAAVTCSEVRSRLFPCLSYATGSVGSPSNECCNQVRNLNSQSRTPEDRRAACKCVKELARTVVGVRPDRATQLPQRCGVNVDPNQDCDSIR